MRGEPTTGWALNPIRTPVCGLQDLFTTTLFTVIVGVSLPRLAVPRFTDFDAGTDDPRLLSPPNCSAASLRACSTSMSPKIASTLRDASTRSWYHCATSSRVNRPTFSFVPIDRNWYGDSLGPK